jgi:hypothetical protein
MHVVLRTARYLQKWERPEGSVLGVVGDFEPQAMLSLLEQRLGDWRAAPGQPAKPPEVRCCVGDVGCRSSVPGCTTHHQ